MSMHNEPEKMLPPAKDFSIGDKLLQFQINEEIWDDSSYIFYGYKSTDSIPITIWNEKDVPLEFYYIPDRAPYRINPFAPTEAPVQWMKKIPEITDRFAKLMQEIAVKSRPIFDDENPHPVLDFFNYKELRNQIKNYSETYYKPGLTNNQRYADFSKAFSEIAKIVKAADIPDKYMNEDDAFPVTIMQLYTAANNFLIQVNKGQLKDIIDEDFVPAIKSYMQAAEEKFAKIKRKTENLSSEELKEILELEDELESLPSDISNNERQVEIMDKLWQNKSLMLNEKLKYAYQLNTFMQQAKNMLDNAVEESRKSNSSFYGIDNFIEFSLSKIEELKSQDKELLFSKIKLFIEKHKSDADFDSENARIVKVAVQQTKSKDNDIFDILLQLKNDSKNSLLNIWIQDGELLEVRTANN